MEKKDYKIYLEELFKAKLCGEDVIEIISKCNRSKEDAENDLRKVCVLQETVILLIKKAAEENYNKDPPH